MVRLGIVTEKQECRGCEEPFSGEILLNFGEQTIVDFLSDGELGRGSAPLQLVRCKKCGLVQLKHTVDPDVLYKKFWYRSSVNEQMRMALYDVVTSAQKKVKLKPGDWVLDIGSNDGELLLNYPADVFKVGFEPAEELASESEHRFLQRKDQHFSVSKNYFEANESLFMSAARPYKIITAIAMFYDLDNPSRFLLDVRGALAHDGVFVVQMNYLGLMVRNMAFDNIGHEHLCYYSLTVLRKLFDEVGLDIFDMRLNNVNGGSIRIYAGHKEAGWYRESVIDGALITESKELSEYAILNFAERVQGWRTTLLAFLKELKRSGKKVYAYGASTRGMTLLQTLFVGERATDYIIAAAERDEKKYGKRMAGLDIPICTEELARYEADFMLVLPYHFWESIQEREKDWMKKGGKFILPLPYPKVVQLEDIGLVTHDLDAALAKA